MDLDDLKPATEARALTLLHPTTGVEMTHDGKPVTLMIQGPQAPDMLAVDRAVQNKRLKTAQRTGRINITSEEIEAETIEKLATSITGWANLQQGGRELVYSHVMARKLMTDYPWMRNQVDQFFRDEGNFLTA